MLKVELNIAGFRFSREIRTLSRKSVGSAGLSPRPTYWRLPHLRQSRAA
jgi:hypothetical protein